MHGVPGSLTAQQPGRQTLLRRRIADRVPATKRMWALWLALWAGALVMIFPVYWILVTAVTPGGLSQSGEFFLWPDETTFANFTEAFTDQPVWRWLLNSTLVASIGCAASVLVSLMAGYAFAKFQFRGRTALFVMFLLAIMIPVQVTMVPAFLVVANLQLVDTIWAVILPRVCDVMGIFIARQFMLNVPGSLIEAGRIDGAGEFTIFRRVVLPTCGPLIGVLVILSFMGQWNDFLWPMLVLQDTDALTLPVGLGSMVGNTGIVESPWGSVMAVAFVAIFPLLVVFMVFQRQFVQGIASTGIK